MKHYNLVSKEDKLFVSIRKMILLIIVLFTSTNIAYTQENMGSILFRTMDNEGLDLEFATVVLYKSNDSTVVKVVMTEVDGTAIFEEIEYGNYYVYSGLIGYSDYYSKPFVLDSEVKQLEPVKMKPDMELDEVVVRARIPLIERKLDRIVLNVDATQASVGGALSDVLKMSPGVVVGNNGSLTLKGKSGVLVLIDGRKSYMTGAELDNYINSMPANQFSSIEIMTNPPAKYDADGKAGIINIITKRNNQKGWNLDLGTSYRQGRLSELNQSLGFNVNGNKFGLFGNISFSDQDNFDDYLIQRRFQDDAGNALSIYDQRTFIDKDNQILNGKLGMDIFLSEKTTTGFLIGAQKANGSSITNNNTFLRDSNNALINTLVAPADTNSDLENLKLNTYLTHKIDTVGGNISVNLDYLQYNSQVNQLFENNFFNSTGLLEDLEILDNKLPQAVKIYNAQIDYVQPLSDKIKVEAGFKTSFVNTDNNAKFFENIDNVLIENQNLSNYFIYDENVNAGYLNYVQTMGELTLQAGLRTEHTAIKGNQVTLNQTFENSYTQLLPSIFISYQLDDESQIGFNYGKRIERPDYRDLNPFRYFYDALTFEEGNPNLNPEFVDKFELNYSILEGAVSSTAYYNKTNDIITDVIFQNSETNETFIRKDNLNNLITYGISLDGSVPITDNWNITLSLDYSDNELMGEVDNELFNIRVNTFSGVMLHTYKFAKTWTFEMAAWYTSESLEDTFIREPYGRLALAIGKNFHDGKGRIRLSGNDIFDWTNFNARSAFPNTDVQVKNNWQTQTVRLAISYKLGSNTMKKREDRKSSIEQESERLD